MEHTSARIGVRNSISFFFSMKILKARGWEQPEVTGNELIYASHLLDK